MGYSCTAVAAMVQDEMVNFLQSGDNKTSNTWVIRGRKYFYERGRENGDGRITGTVWESVGNMARKRGNYCITADGEVKSWPTSTALMRINAALLGREKYKQKYSF
jgi:hypothetical protein